MERLRWSWKAEFENDETTHFLSRWGLRPPALPVRAPLHPLQRSSPVPSPLCPIAQDPLPPARCTAPLLLARPAKQFLHRGPTFHTPPPCTALSRPVPMRAPRAPVPPSLLRAATPNPLSKGNAAVAAKLTYANKLHTLVGCWCALRASARVAPTRARARCRRRRTTIAAWVRGHTDAHPAVSCPPPAFPPRAVCQPEAPRGGFERMAISQAEPQSLWLPTQRSPA